MGELDEFGLTKWDTIATEVPGIHRLTHNVTNTHCLGPGDIANVDPDHRVPPFVGTCDMETQKGATAIGLVARPAFVCRSCRCNAHNSLCNRHCKKRPQCLSRFLAARDWFDHFQDTLHSNFQLQHNYWHYNWILKWNPSKRLSILRSSIRDALRYDKVELMVKREVLGGFKAKARGIQKMVNLRTQAETGPICTAIQKSLASVFNLTGEFHDGCQFIFASGLNSEHFGEWMDTCLKMGMVFFYERDGANWDATMGIEHHAMKTHVYKYMSHDFVDAVDKMRDVKGIHFAKKSRLFENPPIKYSVCGTTKSGHNDTSLGNSIVNFAIALEALKKHGVGESGRIASCLVMGDDLLVASNFRFDLDLMMTEEINCGIAPESRTFEDPRDVSFISGIFYPTDKGWRFGPRPGSLLAKVFWTVSPPTPREMQPVINGICESMTQVYGSWPIIGEFFRSHRKPGRSTRLDNKFGIWKQQSEVNFDDTTRTWFESRYALTTSDIARVEALFAGNHGSPGFIRDPAIDRIVERDLASLEDRELF